MLVKIDDLISEYEGSQLLRKLLSLIENYSQNGYIDMLDLCDHIDLATSLEIIDTIGGIEGREFIKLYVYGLMIYLVKIYNHNNPNDDRVSHLMETCERFMNGEQFSHTYIRNSIADAITAKIESYSKSDFSCMIASDIIPFASSVFENKPEQSHRFRVQRVISLLLCIGDDHHRKIGIELLKKMLYTSSQKKTSTLV